MSLDVSLYKNTQQDLIKWEERKQKSLDEAGSMVGLIPLINEYYEDRKPSEENSYIYDANITHNLTTMADKAGVYKHLWRPEELGISVSKDLIEPLTKGLAKLESNPAYYKQFDAANGWGVYDDFVPWVRKYLAACIENPEAIIHISR